MQYLLLWHESLVELLKAFSHTWHFEIRQKHSKPMKLSGWKSYWFWRWSFLGPCWTLNARSFYWISVKYASSSFIIISFNSFIAQLNHSGMTILKVKAWMGIPIGLPYYIEATHYKLKRPFSKPYLVIPHSYKMSDRHYVCTFQIHNFTYIYR